MNWKTLLALAIGAVIGIGWYVVSLIVSLTQGGR